MANLVEQLKEQRKMELSHVKELKTCMVKAQNKLVAALLESIVLDSQKYATICQALVDVKAGEMPASTDLDKGAVPDLQQEIKQLIRVEADMLTRMG